MPKGFGFRKEVCIDDTVEQSCIAEKSACFQEGSSLLSRAVLKWTTLQLDQLEHRVPALKGLKLEIIY